MGRMKRKYESGAAITYVSRNRALRKLQLSLADFRRLCILKGIHPQEPLHKKKVNRGSTVLKTYYHVKDIKFLLHEPLIRKFRELKHFTRRLRKEVSKKNQEGIKRVQHSQPRYSLHHIVKERYPYFTDAIQDLPDCLTLCFTFSNFPATRRTHSNVIHECRRLTVEFQHYVIASRSLQKVFVSIKGYYYEAEIMGEKVVWVVPHKFGHKHPQDVDYKIMATFIEFYTAALSFINYKLFCNINLKYPPKVHISACQTDDENGSTEDGDNRVEALTYELLPSGVATAEEEAELDVFNNFNDDGDLGDTRMMMEEVGQFQKLFRNCKFFLGREVPRENLTFLIRSFEGHVSWDKTVGPGSLYDESDSSITHQIVDRPTLSSQNFDRYYVQPQWVFDSINTRRLLPAKDYFVGAELPPHLSPFVEEEEGEYIPPEKLKLLSEGMAASGNCDEEVDKQVEDNRSDDGGESSDDDDGYEGEGIVPGSDEPKENDLASAETLKDEVVVEGRVEAVDVPKQSARQLAEEKRLAEMMIRKKHRCLYMKIQYKRKKIQHEARVLREKREAVDMEKKNKNRGVKKLSV